MAHESFLSGWEPGFFSVDTGALRYFRSRPTGKATVVFIAGWASTPKTWRKFLPTLAESTEVYYLETREKATSTGNWQDQSIASAVADISRFIDNLGLSSPILLIGASTGANLLLDLLSRRREGILGAALITPHRSSPIPRYFSLIKVFPSWMLPGVSRTLTWLAGGPLLPSALRQQREGLLAAVEAGDLRRLRESAAGWQNLNVQRSQAAAIVVPVLVIGAANDGVHKFDDAKTIAGWIPGAKFEEQRNFAAIHGPNCARQVVSFMQGLNKR